MSQTINKDENNCHVLYVCEFRVWRCFRPRVSGLAQDTTEDSAACGFFSHGWNVINWYKYKYFFI